MLIKELKFIAGMILHEDTIKSEDKQEGESEKEKQDKNEKKCKVETFGGNSKNSCCQFPFKMSGRMYHDCTTFKKRHMWCGTTHDYDKDGMWGFCCQGEDCL